ncbi:MAG: 50S ribosomal protein L5 [Pseudomonadota bacterium]|nr:50S ribosomal protein L5 [Gammaproteobacteria bacterium]MEE2684138.1 50S ribosomal protein L5 [Pseudomonadota bacterium]|tara:strand:- start:12529 stop:13068 length:540 start_codon:yes stop_codon:yes gene_type:complete
MARLKDYYHKEVVPMLMEKLSVKNPMAVPRINKITLNMGVGEAISDRKALEQAANELKLITGRQPILCKARISVATFKLRAGFPIGCKVTLRREIMYEFLDRLINITIPRFRDFRGLSPKSFDGFGNYNVGVKEQIVFPEIDFDKVSSMRGLDIAITTSARNDDEGRLLLDAFQFPIKN